MTAPVQVQCLEAVVRTKSFRAAAASLHMSQSAVSGHISRLERQLNLQLIDRSFSGASLTRAGASLLPHLRAFADSAESISKASEFLRDGEAHRLSVKTIRAGLTHILPTALAMLRESFESNLVVQLAQAHYEEICDSVLDGTCDIGLTVTVEGAVRDGVDDRAIMPGGPLGVSGLPDHPLLRGDVTIDPADLVHQALIVPRSKGVLDVLEQMVPSADRSFVCIVPDADIALNLAAAGVGLAVLIPDPRWLGNAAVSWRPLRGAPETSVRLITALGGPTSAPAAALAEYLEALARSRN